MTKAMRDSESSVRKEGTDFVSSDVNFKSGKFPEYMVGDNNDIIEHEENPEVPSLKEIVAKECSELLEQQRRQTVRDIAKKFEEGLSAAAKLSVEEKWKQVSSLEKQVLLKKLRDILFGLRSQVADQCKEDVAEAITMVEALAVQLTQREGELLHERAEVKKTATSLKQAIENAKKVVEEERATARREIELAYSAMERVEKALQEQEMNSSNSDKHDEELEKLKEEVQEARRIKMLHQPSKVMEMEHELCALRIQLAEKTSCCVQLKKELAKIKRYEEEICTLYEFKGSESLGSCLHIVRQEYSAPNLSSCSVQWYRLLPDGSKLHKISGATKELYAPEPFDVGYLLQAQIIFGDQRFTVTTIGPIDPAAGLGSFVEELVKMPDTEFKVIVCQLNGYDYASNSIHVLHVGKLRMKLCQGKTSKARERYSSTMQLCGVRGGGSAAAQSLFWKATKDLSFVLAFESDRERNAAIMLARRFASDYNVVLAGPNDRLSNGA